MHDQDVALDFYTRKLGCGEGPALVLMPVPGPPMLDEKDSVQLSELVANGAGGTLFLESDDCKAAYDKLSTRGVTFNDPPTSQPYGIDTSFRDPWGNNIRLTQVLEFDPGRG
ncbi:VOC family protein [Streptomyces sp. NPDC001661]